MKNRYVFVAAMLFTIAALGVAFIRIAGSWEKEHIPEENLQIVTSFYPVYIGALNITDNVEGITVTNLTESATGCLHDYQLSTDDMVILSRADIFFVNGKGMESFIEDVAKQYPGLKIIETGKAYENAIEEPSGHTGYADNIHIINENPHIWLSLEGYRTQLETMAASLSEINPNNRDAYHKNMETYFAEIHRLEAKTSELLVKTSGVKVILFHEGFEYLSEMLGMEAAAVLDMDEDTSLNAGELSELVDLVKEEGVLYLLCEEEHGRQAADIIAGETGIKVITIDPLTSGVYEKEAYIRVMENNLDILSNSVTSLQEAENGQ